MKEVLGGKERDLSSEVQPDFEQEANRKGEAPVVDDGEVSLPFI